VRAQLAAWRHRAAEIEDPVLRELAERKLREERFNVEVSATLATLAPRRLRKRVIEAIVALQVAYDYLDLLGERPLPDPLGDAGRLFEALTDAFELQGHGTRDYYGELSRAGDGGYLQALVDTVRSALRGLPAGETVAPACRAAAARCAQAQAHEHAVPQLGIEQLQRWARSESAGSALGWQEFLAGSQAAVVGLHASISAAAEVSTSREEAFDIDAAYISIGALTMLDSLVDRERDLQEGRHGYIQYYGSDPRVLGERLEKIVNDAAARASALPHGAHHLLTLMGIVAYYASAPTARSDQAGPVVERVCAQLRPLITPTLALMRGWRKAKALRAGPPSRAGGA
jgi:tetraprenyl-beta-curcumene synthase